MEYCPAITALKAPVHLHSLHRPIGDYQMGDIASNSNLKVLLILSVIENGLVVSHLNLSLR